MVVLNVSQIKVVFAGFWVSAPERSIVQCLDVIVGLPVAPLCN